jgi:hypothetical protein
MENGCMDDCGEMMDGAGPVGGIAPGSDGDLAAMQNTAEQRDCVLGRREVGAKDPRNMHGGKPGLDIGFSEPLVIKVAIRQHVRLNPTGEA